MTEEEGFLEPQAELVASPLRFVELLLFEPLVVVIEGVTMHAAAPAMFIAQKVLMRDGKTGRKEDKDLVSIYEACLLSEPRWKQERESVIRATATNEVWPKWLSRVAPALQKLFGSPTAPGAVAVEVALRHTEKAPSARAVSRVVMDAAASLFEPR